ncbi:MAG: hypothetical protein LBT84_01920 [Spirochaetia bacterium]|jgi:hypothetical protein|nr:hypothetical protein [Spirochaetia bacterium]
MKEKTVSETDVQEEVDIHEIAPFADQSMLTRILDKLTDYTDIISEAKLTSIINFSYNLDSAQINSMENFLANSRAVSRIFLIAQKGSRDLDHEYISNVFSTPENPENSPAYVSIRNTMELRLTQQTQQFNMNMGIPNVAKSMPLNTLRNQVRSFQNAQESGSSASSKVQHSYIAASLHDAYVTLITRVDFWNDKTYMKFFFNEDSGSRNMLLTLRQEKKSLHRINKELSDILRDYDIRREEFVEPEPAKANERPTVRYVEIPIQNADAPLKIRKKLPPTISVQNDPTMQTPFGKQYGGRINTIIMEICNKAINADLDIDAMALVLSGMYNKFISDPSAITPQNYAGLIIHSVESFLFIDTDITDFAEKFLYINRKESFPKFFQDNSSSIETFMSLIFDIYFAERFKPFLKFMKTDEMLTFTCAFIIKRLYIIIGDALTIFGFFLIKAVGRIGKIQMNNSD